MADLERFQRKTTGLLLQPTEITPSDGAEVDEHDVIYIGTAGDIVISPLGVDPALGIGDAETLTLGAGYHPIPINKVWATGTTASNIIGFIQSD